MLSLLTNEDNSMTNSLSSYILLGSNIGNRLFYLDNAQEQLSEHFKINKISSTYETASWGDRSQKAYLNRAIEIEVELSPSDLHSITRNIEKNLGRIDKGNFLPRTIDIDIIFFGNEIIDSRKLTIPHPRLQNRRFVLEPLIEICPTYIHPILNKSVKVLLEECLDTLPVELFKEKKISTDEI